jgi:type II secretory pathway pseudopilin PulG
MELLFVVVLLGILGTIVVGAVSGVTTQAAESSCSADRHQLNIAAQAYLAQADARHIPATGITTDRHELTLVDAGFLRGASSYHDLDADGIVTTQEESPC